MTDRTQRASETSGGLVDAEGRRWYRIERTDLMAPFLTIVVSDDDLWGFLSSVGTLTIGRVDADQALLPYETDDRLHRAAGITGPVTVLARRTAAGRDVWRPYDRRTAPGCRRALSRDVLGTACMLEEVNDDWGATIRTTWRPAPRYGWVRTVELSLAGDVADGEALELEVLDGLLDIMPPGVSADVERRSSNLVDAYKRSEVVPGTAAATYALESLITDRAEPAEALAATLVWTDGLGGTLHLDETAVDAMLDDVAGEPTSLLTGRRGCHLRRARVTVPAGGSVRWHVVVDGPLDHAALHDRLATLGDQDAVARIEQDIADGADRVASYVAAADGEQASGDPVADAHHASNVLYNLMRGGVFPHGHEVPTDDLAAFVASRNARVAARAATVLDGLPPRVAVDDLRERIAATGDVDLRRLLRAYLPLTFSRRHGDPSRPWNRFSIRVRDDEGQELLTYEGNWRDIFQNWEALLRSYPAWYPHVVATFVDATSAEGYNAYRISRDGIDWEVPDEDDPWSNIGYWGDHQLVYLLRLVRGWLDADPAALDAWLTERSFSHADIPYVLVDHDAMVTDPRDTVHFDEPRHERTSARVADVGADGRLVTDDDGTVVHVTFLEKLLLPALAKLGAFVPGGGIWMNTQRPEWNDANNALAGWGLSMVTTFHLDQYLALVRAVLERSTHERLVVSAPVAAWVGATAGALDADPASARDDDHARRELLDALGRAAAHYRRTIADGFDATQVPLPRADLDRLLSRAAAHVDATLATSRRPDGLVDSYQLLHLEDGVARVERLEPMLEGQVAAVSSSAIADDEVAPLVDAMVASDLHRADLDTFMLYPATSHPPFVERNTIPAARAEGLDLPATVRGRSPTSILRADRDGALHVRADLSNADALRAALDEVGAEQDTRETVLELYEELFDHHAFTGRSGAMHGYEGIGSVYWHMVGKLLLAVQERYLAAVRSEAPADVVDALAGAYRRVRDGLGFRMDPATFGAIPTDCYSHTPAHAGAQQPGMTGQVKEHVLARLGEAGLVIRDGRLALTDSPLTRSLLVDDDRDPPGWSLFVCGTPVHVELGPSPRVRVEGDDDVAADRPERALTREQSTALFARDGRIAAITFTTPQWSGR